MRQCSLSLCLLLVAVFCFLGADGGRAEENSSSASPIASTSPDGGSTERVNLLVERLPAFLRPWFHHEILGYELWRILVSLIVFLLALSLCAVIRNLLPPPPSTPPRGKEEGKKEKQGEERTDRGITWHLFLSTLRRATQVLVWAGAVRILGPILIPWRPEGAIWLSDLLLNIALAIFAYDIVGLVEAFLQGYTDKSDTWLDTMLLPVVRKSLRILVIVIVALHLYKNITNQDISTLLAGLGIGGLAFALAAQDMLKNIFGFAMIVLDRPFVVGERVQLEGHDGTIESVGFRSTRLRRLDGDLVTIPNAKVAELVVHNIGRRPSIRRVMNITIPYDTPVEKVERAVMILRELLTNHEGQHPDWPARVFFNDFNAASLNILAIYWYYPPDYWKFLDFSQRLNLEIMRRFAAEGIEFAFPTQTLYLASDPMRSLVIHHPSGQNLETSLEPCEPSQSSRSDRPCA